MKIDTASVKNINVNGNKSEVIRTNRSQHKPM